MSHTIIMESIFGSHLYGLDTPESDRDYKGIILPTKREILLGNSKFHVDKSTNRGNTKNTKDDVDKTYYSLSYFIGLACRGETVALDLLHGSFNHLTRGSYLWTVLQGNRSKFYTKSMESYIGYTYKQAAKYGIKGSKIAAIESVIGILEQYERSTKVQDLKEILPIDNHCIFVVNPKHAEDPRVSEYYYEVCGSKYASTVKIAQVLESLYTKLTAYGERAQLAKDNIGIDWKALSHSLRAGYQVRAIFIDGGFSYPLRESDFIKRVKLGQCDYASEVAPELEQLVAEVHGLSVRSALPEKVDQTFWDDFIMNTHEEILRGLYDG